MMQRWIYTFLIVALLISAHIQQSFAMDSEGYGLILVNEQKASSTPIADFVSAPKGKSPVKAFLYSAVIPGSGELYIGKKRGIAFMVTEVAFWSAYFVLHGRAEDLRSNYVKYVDNHIAFEPDSPATSTEKWTLEDYEHATQADNWHYVYTDNAGKPIDRVGKFYWKDLPEDKINENGEVPLSESNSNYRAVAYGKRGSTNTKYKQAKIYLSMVVVNHVASAIDARVSAIMQNKGISKTTASINIQPSYSINGKPETYLILRAEF